MTTKSNNHPVVHAVKRQIKHYSDAALNDDTVAELVINWYQDFLPTAYRTGEEINPRGKFATFTDASIMLLCEEQRVAGFNKDSRNLYRASYTDYIRNLYDS